jgi:hypothetical protein
VALATVPRPAQGAAFSRVVRENQADPVRAWLNAALERRERMKTAARTRLVAVVRLSLSVVTWPDDRKK